MRLQRQLGLPTQRERTTHSIDFPFAIRKCLCAYGVCVCCMYLSFSLILASLLPKSNRYFGEVTATRLEKSERTDTDIVAEAEPNKQTHRTMVANR